MKERIIDYTKNYKRTIFTWSLYDFANQPFPTIIITFIYAAFFTQYISAGDEAADVYWLFSIFNKLFYLNKPKSFRSLKVVKNINDNNKNIPIRKKPS